MAEVLRGGRLVEQERTKAEKVEEYLRLKAEEEDRIAEEVRLKAEEQHQARLRDD